MMGIGYVRSSSIAGKKGSSCQQQKIVQCAIGLTTTETHLREFSSMTKDLQLRTWIQQSMGLSPLSAGGKG
jgi:hypothetical protein